ncbi:hypothetical protein M422DRAFT_243377 [Sphaerobolus stellatus SS14]|nr:hypothetical protein M422DRAFT_243377 [Sphaerobolus stellatus SS14]
MADLWHNVTVKVPFASEDHAKIARDALAVDAELNPGSVKRSLTVEGSHLVAAFSTVTIRLARLSVNSFFENVELITRTFGEFADEAEQIQNTYTS